MWSILCDLRNYVYFNRTKGRQCMIITCWILSRKLLCLITPHDMPWYDDTSSCHTAIYWATWHDLFRGWTFIIRGNPFTWSSNYEIKLVYFNRWSCGIIFNTHQPPSYQPDRLPQHYCPCFISCYLVFFLLSTLKSSLEYISPIWQCCKVYNCLRQGLKKKI